MGTQEVKTEIINNVLVAMSYYITQRDIMAALEQVLKNEFVRVNIEEITTLSSVWQGVDIGVIQEVLGHANPAVTSQYYAQSTPKTLKTARERLQV